MMLTSLFTDKIQELHHSQQVPHLQTQKHHRQFKITNSTHFPKKWEEQKKSPNS